MAKLDPTFKPKSPCRRSNRKAVVKRKQTVIHHQLLLGPTLARREKKRSLDAQEQKTTKRQAMAMGSTKRLKIAKKAGKRQTTLKKPLRKMSAITPNSVEKSYNPQRQKIEKAESSNTARDEKPKAPQTSQHVPVSTPAHRVLETIDIDLAVPETIDLTQEDYQPTAVIPSRPLNFNHQSNLETLDTALPSQPLNFNHQSNMGTLDNIMIEVANKRRLTLLRRRKFSLEALLTASDLCTIYAALSVVKDLHEGSELHPMAAQLVVDAQLTGRMLLTQSLLERFASPRSFGGLAYSDTKARLLVHAIVQNFGPLLESMILSVDTIYALGIPLMDAYEILPHLRLIVDGVQRRVCGLTEMLVRVNAEQSLLTQVIHM